MWNVSNRALKSDRIVDKRFINHMPLIADMNQQPNPILYSYLHSKWSWLRHFDLDDLAWFTSAKTLASTSRLAVVACSVAHDIFTL
jgi:hypothetical protein